MRESTDLLSAPGRRSGFTLLEMMMVIVLTSAVWMIFLNITAGTLLDFQFLLARNDVTIWNQQIVNDIRDDRTITLPLGLVVRIELENTALAPPEPRTILLRIRPWAPGDPDTDATASAKLTRSASPLVCSSSHSRLVSLSGNEVMKILRGICASRTQISMMVRSWARTRSITRRRLCVRRSTCLGTSLSSRKPSAISWRSFSHRGVEGPERPAALRSFS